jgi:fatty-acyl-CoA synthase
MTGYPTFPEHLRRVADSRVGEPALLDEGGTATFGELVEQIDRTARALLASGLAPGDRVALALQPSTAYVVLILAAMAAGLVPAPLNTRLTSLETRRYLEPIDPAVVIADGEDRQFSSGLDRSVLEMPAVTAGQPLRQRMAPFDSDQQEPLADLDARLAALILPTGGTSGTPKGVWFDHATLWRCVGNAALNLPRKRADRDLYFAPFFHIMFPAQLLYSLFMGGSTQLLATFDAAASLAALAHGATRLGGAPTLMSRLRQHPDFATTPRDHVSQVLFGAAPSSPGFIEQLLADYPRAWICSMYGATEYGGTVCSIPHEELIAGRLQGVGYPWPGQSVRIVDDEGRQCPPGEVGYFSVRAIGQANGYWGLAEQTAEVFRPDGIRVGDMGWCDEDGRFTIIGRDSEMIITGGENVFPSEVERVLIDDPAVADVLVFGVPDDEWGHRVAALVVASPGWPTTSEALLGSTKDKLAGYKRPKEIVFVDVIPVTANNKPDRRAAANLLQVTTEPKRGVEP